MLSGIVFSYSVFTSLSIGQTEVTSAHAQVKDLVSKISYDIDIGLIGRKVKEILDQ
jgi:hypothetical protein